ncbi:MAG: hypothetical protein ACPGKS_02760 [Coraliomargarita sp.]
MDLYHSTDCFGVSELRPDKARMRELIDQLDDPEIDEAEHPDISLTHDGSGWSITLYPSGVATLENLESSESETRYLADISRAGALELWSMLASGKLDALQAKPWRLD